MNDTKATSDVAVDSLENVRTKLLDLSGRNRLLNFSHSRSSHLHVIDELPDQLHGLLLQAAILNVEPPNWRHGNDQSNNRKICMVDSRREQAYKTLGNSNQFSRDDELSIPTNH